MKLNILPLSQRDESIRLKKLGWGTGTIGSYGCLLICHTMMMGYYGHEIDPLQLNEIYKNNGVFTGDSKNLINFWRAGKVFEDIKADESVDCRNTPCDLTKIDKYLNERKPVIVFVDNVYNDKKPDHFVLIIGKTNDGKYLTNDPWMGETYFFDAKWGDPATNIYGLRLYSGTPKDNESCEEKLSKLQTVYSQTNDMLSAKTDEVSILTEQLSKADANYKALETKLNQERDSFHKKDWEKQKEIEALKKELSGVSIENTKLLEKVEKLLKDIDTCKSKNKQLKIDLIASKKESIKDYNLIQFILYKYLRR